MKGPQDYGPLATNLADMVRELHVQDTVQKTLDSAVAHAVKLVEGCEAAGILTVKKGEATTLAASNPVTIAPGALLRRPAGILWRAGYVRLVIRGP